MPERMLNKIAVVTGAGSGIGRAIATRFVNEGAKVVVFGRHPAPLDEIVQVAPARVLAVEGDVTNTADLDQLARATSRRFARVDVLVPAAGVGRYAPLVETSAADAIEQFRVNYVGAAESVRVFLPALASPSSVLFITDALSRTGQPGLGAYHATKSALASLARTLSVELAPRGIRVNCLAPGPVETPFWSKLGLSPVKTEQLMTRLRSRALDERFVSLEAIAETAVFLATDGSSHLRGEEIRCDGGTTIS